MMKRVLWICLIVLLSLTLAACHCPMGKRMKGPSGCGSCCKAPSGQQMTEAKAGSCCKLSQAGAVVAGDEATRADVLFACACGDACECNSLSKQPGPCACGKPMRWHHVLKVEQDEALLCSCDEGCNCSLDAADPSRCACGKPVKRVSLKGSGLFFCNCGGTCTCNTVKAAAGECRCGMQLKQLN